MSTPAHSLSQELQRQIKTVQALELKLAQAKKKYSKELYSQNSLFDQEHRGDSPVLFEVKPSHGSAVAVLKHIQYEIEVLRHTIEKTKSDLATAIEVDKNSTLF